jgi:GTP-binding protein Era
MPDGPRAAPAPVADGAPPVYRSGFVALAGRPNVGKSTLLNQLLGTKVAITAPVPQTTRTVLRGILHRPDAQVVFIDTPGLHRPRHQLGAFMVEVARRALRDADVVAWVVDASPPLTEEDRTVAAALRGVRAPVVLAVNKVDRPGADPGRAEAEARTLVPLAAAYRLSAVTGEGVEAFLQGLIAHLPAGPAYYPEEMLTDQPEQFLVRELIREQVIHHTREEVPHAVAVEVEEFAERPDGTLYVRATIHVERPSQKKILIGRGGAMLRAIGTAARREVEALLGRRCYLDLWVTVTPDWREKPALIRSFYPE